MDFYLCSSVNGYSGLRTATNGFKKVVKPKTAIHTLKGINSKEAIVYNLMNDQSTHYPSLYAILPVFYQSPLSREFLTTPLLLT